MKVLVADDNRFYRLALRMMLEESGYTVIEAEDGKQAFEVLSGPDAPKLAIIDWVMPGLSGPELCRRVRSLAQPEPPYLIILTGLDGQENLVNALNSGADDFITKPFDRRQLEARLKVGIRIVTLQTSQTLIFTLARAVEAKSAYTKGHSDRVTHYALALGERIGLSEADLHVLRRGSLLHDIGKISIPDKILDKPGKLTKEEFDVIKRHPLLGVEILKPLQSLDDILPLVRWHHERCDGKGYPDGLSKNEIPFLVRILSVADVYDALSSERPYRSSISHLRSLQIMAEDAADGGLDMDLVERFTQVSAEALNVNGDKTRNVMTGANSMPLRTLVEQNA